MKKILLTIIIPLLGYTAMGQVCEGVTLLNETFEKGMPPGWMSIDNDGLPLDSIMHGRGFGPTFTVQNHLAQRCVGSSTHVTGTMCDDFLVTPKINVLPGKNYCLGFQAANYRAFGEDSFDVYISTTGNTANDFITTSPIASYQLGANAAWINYSIDLTAYASKPFWLAFRHHTKACYSAIFFDNIKVNRVLAKDLALQSATVAKMMAPGSINPPIVVSNGGKSNITSFTIRRQLNNNAMQSQTYNITVTPGASKTVYFNNSITIMQKGNHTLKHWIHKTNGTVEVNKTNDSLVAQLYIDTLTRKILAEEFTQPSCGPCLDYNPPYDSLCSMYRQNHKLIQLKYHSKWPGYDPMYNENPLQNDARIFYYGIPFIPSVRTNGQFLNKYDTILGSYFAGHPVGITASYFDSLSMLKSVFVLGATAQISGNNINFEVKVKPSTNIHNEQWVLHAVVMEDTIDFNGISPGTNGETIFYQTMRKMLPDENGTLLPNMNAGQPLTYNFTYDYTTCSSCVVDELKLVTFIQDLRTNEVYQCNLSQPVNIIASRTSRQQFAMFPNPTRGQVRLKKLDDENILQKIVVTDAAGRQVQIIEDLSEQGNLFVFELKGLADGIYFIDAVGSKSTWQGKVTLQQ